MALLWILMHSFIVCGCEVVDKLGLARWILFCPLLRVCLRSFFQTADPVYFISLHGLDGVSTFLLLFLAWYIVSFLSVLLIPLSIRFL